MPNFSMSRGRLKISEDISATSGHAAGVGKGFPLGALDGVVGGDVDIGGIGIKGDVTGNV